MGHVVILGCNTVMWAAVAGDHVVLSGPERALAARAARMAGPALTVYLHRATAMLVPRWVGELVEFGRVRALGSEMFVARMLALMALEPETVSAALAIMRAELATSADAFDMGGRPGDRALMAPKESALGQYLRTTWAARVNEANGRPRHRKHRKAAR